MDIGVVEIYINVLATPAITAEFADGAIQKHGPILSIIVQNNFVFSSKICIVESNPPASYLTV